MRHDKSKAADAEIGVALAGGGGPVRLSGSLTIRTVTPARAALAALPEGGTVTLDISALARIDTAGAWLLVTLTRRLAAAGRELQITGASAEAASLMQTVEAAYPVPEAPAPHRQTLADLLERLGRQVMTGVGFVLALVSYLGIFLHRLARALRHPREFRFTSLVHHCEEVGFRAVPIVALMAFLIGVVLAFQGSAQLRQFGAEVFVVDLIAISILRELGILLTSIIVAGRTASAFTAAIGSMKMREEIDAMRTLGLDPAMVLFVPRILALLLMLPILGLIADIAGLFGGALMAWIDLGISPEMFRTRLVEGTDVSHVVVGLIKAPFFALIIGVVGCHAGMQVESNAESLGRMTSNAVVTAIFAVIVADAVFSIFFARLGI
ncbi:MlaE family lipid ABC transporter permease subunit [Aestuariicoccus sp. MJ-SS9]|uniref:ABC transporter permease n=1 Tax=Aestuariicoccus sp. MJ-SS9 TaxID=3079855 RepID=UPI0029071989|nr:MlaE family lipid ABC transporter permease subunit [Aestuariicoccus sp. MJ-SS9]MDU8913376.1 MlaE family lipid ABC transporter permease subunit [Aestuariicoccus sp. MJ-SS9]